MSSFFPTNFLCLLLAALIGWLVGWLLGRLSRSRPAESLDAELAGKLRLCDDERSRLRLEIAELKTKINSLEATAREHQAVRSQLTVATTDLDAATAAIGERNKLRGELEQLRQQLSSFETVVGERDATIAELKHRVTELEWLKWNLKNIEFPVDSFEITAEAKSVIEEVIPTLKSLKNVGVEIGGHTDNVDSEEHNRELSLQRAEAVREYLMKRGVAAEMLTAVGYGAARPIADNGTEHGRQRNRRIEFVVKQ